jgi:hypothetical protein
MDVDFNELKQRCVQLQDELALAQDERTRRWTQWLLNDMLLVLDHKREFREELKMITGMPDRPSIGLQQPLEQMRNVPELEDPYLVNERRRKQLSAV